MKIFVLIAFLYYKIAITRFTPLHLQAIASWSKTVVMKLVHQHLLLITSSSTSHLSSAFASWHMNGCRVVWPAKQICIIQESLCDCVWPHGSVLARLCKRGAWGMHRKKTKIHIMHCVCGYTIGLWVGIGVSNSPSLLFLASCGMYSSDTNFWGQTGAHCSSPPPNTAMPGFHPRALVSNILLKALTALLPGCLVGRLNNP